MSILGTLKSALNRKLPRPQLGRELASTGDDRDITRPWTPVTQFGTASFAEAAPKTDTDPVAQMLERLNNELQPATDSWIEQIHNLVNRVQSLEQLRDELITLLPEMTLDDYAAALAQALSAAQLAGRTDITGEAARDHR
ncbi:DUF935 family protein [Enterobacteriaceae bacterium ESL0689]|nr:DUF935 family protein [Enterobacteriaceae bacterium ESL0689]